MTKSAIVVGATGLVGQYVVKQLLQHPAYEHVTSMTRRAVKHTTRDHGTHHNLVVDFDAALQLNDKALEHNASASDDRNRLLTELAQHDELYLCLGTTMKQAKTRQAFQRVDQTYTVELAKLAKQSGINAAAMVSAISSSSSSPFFYARVKANTEADLRELSFAQLVIIQPSIILGQRQPIRPMEALVQHTLPLLTPIMVGRFTPYRAIHARDIARLMITELNTEWRGTHTIDVRKLITRS